MQGQIIVVIRGRWDLELRGRAFCRWLARGWNFSPPFTWVVPGVICCDLFIFPSYVNFLQLWGRGRLIVELIFRFTQLRRCFILHWSNPRCCSLYIYSLTLSLLVCWGFLVVLFNFKKGIVAWAAAKVNNSVNLLLLLPTISLPSWWSVYGVVVYWLCGGWCILILIFTRAFLLLGVNLLDLLLL